MDAMRYNLLKRPEDPHRMVRFRERLQDIPWANNESPGALDQLFRAVDELAEAEVYYYHRRRNTRAWISGVARTIALATGSIGLLIPLLAGAGLAWPAGPFRAELGYVFLAISAGALTANTLFGGTAGHVRFVTTQLKLEKLITASRIGWYDYLSNPGAADEASRRGFTLILDYATKLHDMVLAETGDWAGLTLAALEQFQKDAQNKGAGKTPP
ncbi:SLATT domain-containing protein [Chitinimonas sp.]|uniref:SLATT domain-containing protein n=1 Tax=Chitinimonas sp. TaxID=1934313 RepID=UPI002F957C61